MQNSFNFPPIPQTGQLYSQPSTGTYPQMPQIPPLAPTASLGLNQIEGFQPVQGFVDETNTRWTLVKAASNSTIDIPDPKTLQVLDYWNTEFPGIKTKLYVYVVEGVKPPRVETEQPTRVMYQWFSTRFVREFTPQMITEREWLRANVYAAPIVNARMSKLRAICHIENGAQPVPEQNDNLLRVEELNGLAGGNQTEAGERNPAADGVV